MIDNETRASEIVLVFLIMQRIIKYIVKKATIKYEIKG